MSITNGYCIINTYGCRSGEEVHNVWHWQILKVDVNNGILVQYAVLALVMAVVADRLPTRWKRNRLAGICRLGPIASIARRSSFFAFSPGWLVNPWQILPFDEFSCYFIKFITGCLIITSKNFTSHHRGMGKVCFGIIINKHSGSPTDATDPNTVCSPSTTQPRLDNKTSPIAIQSHSDR